MTGGADTDYIKGYQKPEGRGQKVLLDADVAQIYGVETREINKTVSNNPDKFPAGYVVELSKTEKMSWWEFPPVQSAEASNVNSSWSISLAFLYYKN